MSLQSSGIGVTGTDSGGRLDYIDSPLDFQPKARKASSGAYWSKKGYRTDHRLYIDPPPLSKWSVHGRGGYSTDTLTPLDEIYAPKISSLPYVIQQLCRAEFWDKLGEASWPEKDAAAAWLERSVDSFVGERLDVAYDFEEIEIRARRYAQICEHIPTYRGICEYIASKGFELPIFGRNNSEGGSISRARAHRWWRRKLSRRYRRSAEQKLRVGGFVARRKALYCSTFALSARRQQAANSDRYLRERVVVSSAGEQLNLFDVWKGSLANPAIRRAELMTRMRGFEECAKELGHVAEFITLTCPSEYHAINADGKANPNYKNHTVREGQAWLNKMWARARAKLKKLSVLVYGFRVAEPHHDATPHWHMVLFAGKADIGTLRTVLRGYWLSEHGSEAGALSHRIKFESINVAKGSATGYLSKYIAKNIDGFEVGEDYEAEVASDIQSSVGAGDSIAHNRGADLRDAAGVAIPQASGKSGAAAKGSDATNTSQRVGAWASLHGIRQFQQIGGPQVTIYRELRRVRPDAAQSTAGSVPHDRGHTGKSAHVVSIERARVCADAGDWCGFVKSIGGIAAGRSGSLALWKEIPVNKDTGEVRANGYGEARGPALVGVRAALGSIRTRTKEWRIVKCGTAYQSSPSWRGISVWPSGSAGGTDYGGGPTDDVPGTVGRRIKEIRKPSHFGIGSASSLGPVSITVASGPSLSDPHGWTNPNETSMYGPL